MRAAIKPSFFTHEEGGVREPQPGPHAEMPAGLWPLPPDVEPPDPANEAELRRRRDIARMAPCEREAALRAIELGQSIGDLLAYLKGKVTTWLRRSAAAQRTEKSRPLSINVLRIRRARLYRRDHAAPSTTRYGV